MEDRRRTPRRNWTIGRNDQGQATLEWHVDHRDTTRQIEDDPLARTYDFLKKLDVPNLTLEEDGGSSEPQGGGWNPYDTGIAKLRKSR